MNRYICYVTVYLYIGIISLMTVVAVVNSIPELNMSTYFLTPEKNSDTPETQRLTPPNSPNNNTTSYSATATEEY